MFFWDGRSLQWIIPAVPPAEVTLPETGSSLAPSCQSSAETETSWRWHSGALNYDVCDLVHNWNSLSADPSVEIPEHLQEKPGPSSRNLTAPVGFSKNMEMFSELLSMDMSKLSVDENQDFSQNVAPLRSLETFWCPGGSGGNRTTLSARVGIFPGPKFHLFCKNDCGLMAPSSPSFHRCQQQTWPTSSRIRPMGCWCQTWRCSLTFAISARQFFPETPAPEETFSDTFTPTSPKINPPMLCREERVHEMLVESINVLPWSQETILTIQLDLSLSMFYSIFCPRFLCLWSSQHW